MHFHRHDRESNPYHTDDLDLSYHYDLDRVLGHGCCTTNVCGHGPHGLDTDLGCGCDYDYDCDYDYVVHYGRDAYLRKTTRGRRGLYCYHVPPFYFFSLLKSPRLPLQIQPLRPGY